ncbi:hypothetical protein H0H87_009843 [Tephrocybe sp. NHM501043]|nr:hypothetical protein H0H87_009843 [Tephrocybe sp. NHM501043]
MQIAHARCSETFYKKEVESEIRSEPSKTPQERMKMMELLRKFEEENHQTVDEERGEEDDGEDLARRFEDIDLGTPCIFLVSQYFFDSLA